MSRGDCGLSQTEHTAVAFRLDVRHPHLYPACPGRVAPDCRLSGPQFVRGREPGTDRRPPPELQLAPDCRWTDGKAHIVDARRNPAAKHWRNKSYLIPSGTLAARFHQRNARAWEYFAGLQHLGFSADHAPSPCSTPPSRLFPNRLKIDDFRHFECGRYLTGHRTQPNDRRKVAHSPVQLGQHETGDRGEARRTDDQGYALPLIGGQRHPFDELNYLFRRRSAVIELALNLNHVLDATTGQRLDGLLLAFSQRMAEIEDPQRFSEKLCPRSRANTYSYFPVVATACQLSLPLPNWPGFWSSFFVRARIAAVRGAAVIGFVRVDCLRRRKVVSFYLLPRLLRPFQFSPRRTDSVGSVQAEDLGGAGCVAPQEPEGARIDARPRER